MYSRDKRESTKAKAKADHEEKWWIGSLKSLRPWPRNTEQKEGDEKRRSTDRTQN